MSTQISQLFQKEMTRKEFLLFIGLGFLAVIGISSRLKSIGELFHWTPQATKGFGSSKYGQ